MNTRDLSYQFEVHGTTDYDAPAHLPQGFWETTIQNFDTQGNLVQRYRLHTCRFRNLSDIPRELEKQYIRFKVERKIVKVLYKAGTEEVNEDYFSTPCDCEGIEIHITGAAENHIPSAVDNVAHQSLFLKRTENLTRQELGELIERYRGKATKLYVEAVLYDNNEALDRAWQSACH